MLKNKLIIKIIGISSLILVLTTIYSYWNYNILLSYKYKNYEVMNIMDFKKKFNELEENQLPINEAIKYASKNNIKKIIIPEGVYNIYKPIDLYGTENIIISGVENVRINYDIQEYYTVNIGNSKGIVIDNIKFINKGSRNNSVIYCGVKSSLVRITSCEFYDSIDTVIKLYNTSNVIVDNNKFINSSKGCIQVLNTPTNIYIYKNYIENYCGIGIKIYSPIEYIGKNIFIKSNNIIRPLMDRKKSDYTIGIEIHQNNKNIVVSKNLINGSVDMGISLSNTTNVICKDNTILNNEIWDLSYGVGLEVVSSKYCIIKNNHINGYFNRNNIFLDKSKNCVLNNNILIGEKKSDYTNENYILEIDGNKNKIINNKIINGTYGILVHQNSQSNIYINNILKYSYRPLSLRNNYKRSKDIYIYNKIDCYDD